VKSWGNKPRNTGDERRKDQIDVLQLATNENRRSKALVLCGKRRQRNEEQL